MLCSKCHNHEATVHVTSIIGDQLQKIDLCDQCAAPTGFENFDIEQLKTFSVVGKNCEFCRKAASSGQLVPGGGAIYWCSDCGMEFGAILMELIKSERPDLMQPSSEEGAVAYISNPGLAALATQKAMQILREKRRQDGRDAGR